MHQIDPETKIPVPDDDPLYPYINNDTEYGFFEDKVDSYYLDSQIKDNFQCNHDCYSHQQESTVDDLSISCTHAYNHIVQHTQDLSDSTQQHTLHSMEENTSLFTGLIKSHFWLEIPLKLDHQKIQIKASVCDSECPYDLTLGQTSMKQLSAWQDYASHKLYIQQISVPLTVRNNVWVLPGKTRVVSLTLQPNKTSLTARHTITRKGVAYVKPSDSKLPLRPIEIEFDNNRCCIEVHNTSNTTVEFLHGQEMAYFDARSKGLVQTNNSKHFPIDQYLHDRMTPATLSPTPLAYEKPIHPTEMSCITTCTELSVDDMNKFTSDDKYPWLESDDIRRNMIDSEIL